MIPLMLKLLPILCACALLPALAPASQQLNEAAMTLSPGAVTQKDFAVAQSHSYSFALKNGQYVQFFIQQKGIEIVGTLFGANGQKISEFSESVGDHGVREISYIAPEDGTYRLLLRPYKVQPAIVPYEIEWKSSRTATPQDEQRVRAIGLTVEARKFVWTSRPIPPEDAQKIATKFQELIQLWQSLEDSQMVAECLLDLGILTQRAGDQIKALGLYEQALAKFPAAPAAIVPKATALNNIADLYYRFGETQKSLDYYQQCLSLKKPGRSRAISLDNLGGVYARIGEYQKALELHQQALTLFRERKLIRDEAVALNNIAEVWGKIGDFNRALEYNLQALSLIRQTGDKVEEARHFYNQGNYHLKLADYPRALEAANQGLALIREAKHPTAEADMLSLLCNVYHAQAELEKASEACRSALTRHQTAKDRPSIALDHATLGRIYQTSGDRLKAAESFDAALNLYREMDNSSNVLTMLHLRGKLSMDNNDWAGAQLHFEQAMEIAETLRVKTGSPQMRSTYLAGLQNVYESYVDLMMRLGEREPGKGYEQKALQFNERARARGLLDLLVESRAQIRAGADPQLLEKERALLQKINDKDAAWKRYRNNERMKAQAEKLSAELSELNTQLQIVEADIRKSSPRYADLTQPQPLTAGEIQQLLDNDTVLLQYALGERQSWLWAITRDAMKSYPLPRRGEINKAARILYEHLVARQPNAAMSDAEQLKAIAAADEQWQADSKELSRMLLGPIAGELQRDWKGRRLVFIAAGALEYLPFAVLPVPATDSSFPVPLLADHEIVNLPSASALAAIRRENMPRESHSKAIAVLADPVFEPSDPRLAISWKKQSGANQVIASVRSAESNAAGFVLQPDLARSVRSFTREGFGRLMFSREEAESILKYVPPAKALKATGFQANLALATSGELGRYRILHFGTHGLINSEHPELSGLVLSLLDQNGKPRDGFLRMHELFNLQLPADLVVLSACQTALGKEIRGEGLIGLTRGFMYAGAQRVVASLWQVDDQATALLMQYFYRGILKDGLRPAAALRAAQLEMSRQKRWAAPYYWAGFVLQGEWR